jgi:hypothetical protein
METRALIFSAYFLRICAGNRASVCGEAFRRGNDPKQREKVARLKVLNKLAAEGQRLNMGY